MKTLPSGFTTEKNKQGNKPILYAAIRWSSGVEYLSDQDRTINDFVCNGKIVNWGNISLKADLYDNAVPYVNNIILDILNTDVVDGEIFSQKLQQIEEMAETVSVTIYQWYEGTEYKDTVILYEGNINETEYDGDICKLTLVPYIKYLNTIEDDPLTLDEFTDAPPESVGKQLPILYGLQNYHKCIDLNTPGRTTVAQTFLTADTTLYVVDVSGFPNSGYLMVGDERLQYTGRNTTSNYFSGLTRPEAMDHNIGEDVKELMTAHYWLIAKHRTVATDIQLYAGKIKIDSSYYTMSQNNTTYIVGRTLSLVYFNEYNARQVFEDVHIQMDDAKNLNFANSLNHAGAVIQDLIMDVLGLSSGYIANYNASNYEITGFDEKIDFHAWYFKVSVAITTKTDINELCLDIAKDSHALFFWDETNKVRLIFIPVFACDLDSIKTITEDNIIENQITIKRGAFKDNIYNKIYGQVHNYYYPDDCFTPDIIGIDNELSQSNPPDGYGGEYSVSKKYKLSSQDVDTAELDCENMINIDVQDKGFIWDEYRIKTTMSCYEVEVGDVVELDVDFLSESVYMITTKVVYISGKKDSINMLEITGKVRTKSFLKPFWMVIG